MMIDGSRPPSRGGARARLAALPGAADPKPEPASRPDPSRSDVEICAEVLSYVLSSEARRTAWILGFLVGSALAGGEAV
jgi:hypothetical protein